MIRRAFALAWIASAATLAGLVIDKGGAALETALAPVRVHNVNSDVRRYPDRICWTWSSDKLRAAFSDDVDVHLDLIDREGRVGNTFVPYLYREDTGEPWQSGLALGVGHYDLPYCVELPRRLIGTSVRLRVRFTPQFHGWRNLWTLPIWTPDIVDPPG